MPSRIEQQEEEAHVGFGAVTMTTTQSSHKPTEVMPDLNDDDEEEEEMPKVKLYWALGLLVMVTAITGVTAEWLLDSIEGVTETGNISREFVGLILLPLVGNAVEHVTAGESCLSLGRSRDLLFLCASFEADNSLFAPGSHCRSS